MLAAYPIRLARDALQDEDGVYWTLDNLIDYLNAATYALASLRPDSKSVTESVALVAGTKQAVPSSGVRLLNITRNMGVGGTTPGKTITLAQANSFNLTRPDWHTDATKTIVRHYIFDNRTPKSYYVWPPIPSTPVVQVEIVYAQEPVAVPLTTDTPAYDATDSELDVSGNYLNPLLEFMLYRAYNKDAETANGALGNQHLAQFYGLLGMDAQKAALVSQENRDRPYGRDETTSVQV